MSRLFALAVVAGIAGALFLGSTCSLLNKPPSVPEISGPTTGIVGVPVTFTATATDPEGDSIAFQFAWGDGDTSDWSALFASGETVSLAHTYLSSRSFTLEARGRDRTGIASLWATGPSVVIVQLPRSYPDSVMTTLSVANGAFMLAYAPAQDRLVVSHRGFDFITVLDVALGRVVRTVTVGDDPGHIALTPSGDHVLVSCARDGVVAVVPVVDSADAVLVQVGPNPMGIAVHPSGKYAYVAVGQACLVAVVNLPDASLLTSIAVGGVPSDVVFSPDGERAYVSDAARDQVLVVRTQDHSLLGTVAVGDNPQAEAMADDGLLFVANVRDTSISVIETRDDSLVATVRMASPPHDLAVLPGGHWVCISDRRGLRYMDTQYYVVADSLDVGLAPEGLAVDEAEGRVFVADYDDIFVVGNSAARQ